MTELKKCPFCGGEAELVDCGKNEWFVRCKKGCVEGKLYRQKCDAKNAWNRRQESRHMRLIDADALIKDLNEYKISFNSDINEAIIFAPTIEAEPIRHGEWITVTDEIFADRHYCSACMNYADVDLYGEEILSKYCLDCGALMDKGKHDRR